MPITSSAKKALRGSAKKRIFNLRRKKDLDEAVKTLKKNVAIVEGDKKNKLVKVDSAKLLSDAYQAIDKALKTGYIKKNTAARKKSRLAALVNKTK